MRHLLPWILGLALALPATARAEPCCTLDYKDAIDPGPGLAQKPRDVAYSPDGGAMYLVVADPSDFLASYVQTWLRDPETDELDPAPDDQVPVAASAFLHVGERLVYVLDLYGEIRVLDRDPATQRLSNPREVGFTTGREGAGFSEDGSFAYVGVRDPNDPTIRLLQQLSFAADGSVAARGATASFPIGLVAGIAIAPDGTSVYVSSGTQTLHAFARDPADGAVTPLADYPVVADPNDVFQRAARVTVHPSGRFVYHLVSAHYIRVWERDPADGLLSFVEDEPYYSSFSSRPVFSQAGTRMIVSSGTGNGDIGIFDVDSTTGELTAAESHLRGVSSLPGVVDDRSAFSPDGQSIAIGRFRFDYNEELLDLESLRPLGSALAPGVVNALDPSLRNGLVETADGSELYSSIAATDQLARFARDAESGELTPVETLDAQVDAPAELVVSPDGTDLYVLGGDGLAWFSIGGGSPVHEATLGVGGEALAISPDGSRLFVTSRLDSTLQVVERAADGAISAGSLFEDDVAGVDGLRGVLDVAVSPDGRFAYATAEPSFGGEDGAALFELTPGAVGFVAVQDIYGAAAARVVVPPDGRHVYFTRNYTFSATADLLVSARDAADGALAHVERLQTPYARLEGLLGNPGEGNGISDMTASPEGGTVYVVNKAEGSLVSLRRRVANGRLRFVEALYEAGQPLEAIVDPGAVVASVDGAHVYVAAEGGARVFGFERILGGGNTVRGFALPRKVKATPFALAASGVVDFGPDPVDLSQPLRVQVGDLLWDLPGLVPNKNGTAWKAQAPGRSIALKGPRGGSSLARLSVKLDGDFARFLDGSEPLTLSIGPADCSVELEDGQFAPGKRGRLVEPAIAIERLAAKTANPLKSKVKVALRVAAPPDAPVDVLVTIGDAYSEAVPAAAFVEKKTRLEYRSKTGPITALRIDRAKGTVTIDLAGPELAEAADPDSTWIGLGLGGDSYVVQFRPGGVAGSRKY